MPFKPKGDLPALVNLKPGDLKKTVADANFAMAKLVVERIKWNIKNEVLHLRPKSRSWARRSLDRRPLIHTGAYVQGLKPRRLSDGSAAIEGDVERMRIHEYGLGGVPARPHVYPTIRRMNRELGGMLDDAITGAMTGKSKKR